MIRRHHFRNIHLLISCYIMVMALLIASHWSFSFAIFAIFFWFSASMSVFFSFLSSTYILSLVDRHLEQTIKDLCWYLWSVVWANSLWCDWLCFCITKIVICMLLSRSSLMTLNCLSTKPWPWLKVRISLTTTKRFAILDVNFLREKLFNQPLSSLNSQIPLWTF